MNIKKNSFLILLLVIFITGGIFIATENVKACSCAKGSFCLFSTCTTSWLTTGSSCSQNGNLHICTTDSVSAASHPVCLIGPTGATPCTGVGSCVDALFTGYKYCTEDKCGIYVSGVNEFGTANDLSGNGDICRVTEDTFLSCSAPTAGTFWDASEGKCVDCQPGTNKEVKICGDLTGTYFGGAACTKTGDNQFESACGADAACDEKIVGATCGAGKTCDASGACVTVAGLALTATASPATIALSGSSTITFKVTKSGANVSGATVSGFSVTGGGTVSAGTTGNDCLGGNTDSNGECTITYTAPAASTVATITATKAAKTGETDSGSASAVVTVSSCTAGTLVKFNSSSYNVGDNFSIRWAVSSTEPSNDYIVCLYNNTGNKVWDQSIAHALGRANIGSNNSQTASAAGTWKLGLSIGLSCPGAPSGCIASVVVAAAAATCVPVTEICTDGIDNDCDTLIDCADLSCNGLPCLGGGTCVIAGGTGTCVVGGGGPAIGFTQPCYQLVGAPIPVSISFSGVDISGLGAKATIVETTGAPGALQRCVVLPGASGTVNSTVNTTGTWRVDLYEDSNCGTTNPPIVVSGNTIVQSTPCAAATGESICNDTLDNDADGDADCADSDCAADPFCAAAPCGGAGMFVSPLGPGYCTIGEILENATNWILSLVASIIILIIIIGGLMYISSTGDEEKLRTSKNVIFYAVIGLGIILISAALIAEVTDLLKG